MRILKTPLATGLNFCMFIGALEMYIIMMIMMMMMMMITTMAYVCFAEGNGTSLMSSAVTVSNYYVGFPAPTSPYSATDNSQVGYMETASTEHLRRSGPPTGLQLMPINDSGIVDGATGDGVEAIESDSRSSAEDEDVSDCSLDVTSSPTDSLALTTRQIEAS